MRKFRVAMIAPPWLPIPPSGYGGIENVLAALIPELLKLDVSVELFTTADSTIPATKTHWLYPEGQYRHIHMPHYDVLPVSIAHLQFAINHIQADGGFDVIHDHNGFLGSFVFYNTGSQLPPVVHTLHGPPFYTPDRIELGIPDNAPMWQQFTDIRDIYFVSISEALASLAPKNIVPQLLSPVHNAVIVDDFPYSKTKHDYFITLARFHPEKGQHIAVNACREFGFSLKMAGSVDNITDPRKLILELANPLSSYRSSQAFRYFSDHIFPYLENGTIEHIGEIKGAEKLDVIKHARALLFPIQWEEPFGMAAIEALACGTPVVAMARGALPEIIEHGKNGFLAKNEREFKQYMQRIDDIDPAECRRSVEARFSAVTMAKKYLAHYQSAVRKSDKRRRATSHKTPRRSA